MRIILRYIAVVVAFGIGGCSVTATAFFGLLMVHGQERILYASMFGLVDLAKMILPALASGAFENEHSRRGFLAIVIYAVLALLSAGAHIGLYATVKDSVIGGADAARAKYETATAEKKALQADIAALGKFRPAGTIDAEIAAKRLDARFSRSKGCTDVTVADSRTLCGEVAALEGEKSNSVRADVLRSKLDDAENRLRQLDVAAVFTKADPQAEQLSNLTGLSEGNVRLAIAILIAVMIEMGSSLLLDIAVVSSAKRAPAVESVEEEVGEVEEVPAPVEPAEASVETWSKGSLQAKRNGSIRQGARVL